MFAKYCNILNEEQYFFQNFLEIFPIYFKSNFASHQWPHYNDLNKIKSHIQENHKLYRI